MDLRAYHDAWLRGASESEAIKAGEDAYFERMAYEAKERAGYEAMERAAYDEMQKAPLVADRPANPDDDGKE